MTSSTSAPSAPFADRELNGTVLLDELRSLREAAVRQGDLNACAQAVEPLRGASIPRATTQLKRLAQERFEDRPEIAALLSKWADLLRQPADLDRLCEHLERLALTSAVLGALWRTAGRTGEMR